MALETWITPEETPVLAAEATALIDARLAKLSEGQRLAYWASIRKAYNTPYNTPVKPRPITILAEAMDASGPALPLAAIAAAARVPEAHAA